MYSIYLVCGTDSFVIQDFSIDVSSSASTAGLKPHRLQSPQSESAALTRSSVHFVGGHP